MLDERYKLKKVFVEGAFGAIDTSWLFGIKDKESRKEIVDTLVDQGRLREWTLFHKLPEERTMLEGLEDEKNIQKITFWRLSKLLDRKSYFDKNLELLRKDLEVMKRRYYCTNNKRFDMIAGRYRKGELNTSKYYKILNRYTEKITGTERAEVCVITSTSTVMWILWVYKSWWDLSRKLKLQADIKQLQEFMKAIKKELRTTRTTSCWKRQKTFKAWRALHIPAKISKTYGWTLTWIIRSCKNSLITLRRART